MTKKTSNLADSYWEKRRELEDAARLKMENNTIKDLTTIFPVALEQIQEKLLSQSDMHQISLNDLLSLPTKKKQDEYRKYVDEKYQELMDSDEAYQEFIDEYFPAYDYARVNRLTKMRADIFSIMASEMKNNDANQKFNGHLENILQRSYSSNANALTFLLGGDFHQLPKKELEAMLNYPWTGKTFSRRLWGNVSKLEERLSNAIVNSVSAGNGVADVLTTMRNDSKISDLFKKEESKFDNAIENLVRTEYAHFAVEGIKKSFADTGVKNAVSWSAEDERVCSICGGMHGKEVKENESGPPYHGRCRCTLMPKMPELDTAAIDAEYEALFGDLLDEFAKDGFGVKLSHPKFINSNVGERGLSGSGRLGSNEVDLDYISSEKFRSKFNQLTENTKVNDQLRRYAQAMLTHRNGTDGEDLYLINASTGELIKRKFGGDNELGVSLTKAESDLLRKYRGNIIGIHNHPTNVFPTGADYAVAGYRKYKFGMIATHDGRLFKYSIGNKSFLPYLFDETVDKYRNQPYNLSVEDAFIKTIKQFGKEYGITCEEIM